MKVEKTDSNLSEDSEITFLFQSAPTINPREPKIILTNKHVHNSSFKIHAIQTYSKLEKD